MSRTGHAGERVLISGFPEFRGKKLVEHLLAREPDAELCVLVAEPNAEAAREYLAGLPSEQRERLRLVAGDVCAMDFGMSGAAYRELAEQVHCVYHFYSPSEQSLDAADFAGPVAGAREMLEFARAAPQLRGVVVLSSVSVSGQRSGVVLEEELNQGQSFRGPLEAALARAELMFERHPECPAAVLRPAPIVGDSRTGDIDRFEWPYPLIVFLLSGPEEIALPLPARTDLALQVVPIDFVVQAAHRAATQPGGFGRRYHLVDAEPPSVRRFCELVAGHAGKRLAPGFNPALFARALVRNPGTRLLSRNPRALFELLGAPVHYADDNARALLAETGVSCPRLESYLNVIVDQVKGQFSREQSPEPVEVSDA